MKILLVNSVFYPAVGWGGPITATFDLARKLTKRGHEVTVYTSNASDYKTNLRIDKEMMIEGFKIHFFKNWSRGIRYFFTPGMIIPLFQNSRNYDVVHINSYRQFQDYIAFIILSILRKSFVLTSHGYVLAEGAGKFYKKTYDFFVGKRLLKSAKRIIAFHEKNSLEYQSMGVRKERIRIIPNTIDLETLPKKGLFKNKLGLSKDSKLVMYMGRIHEEKGVGILIEAFSKINEPNVKLIIVGPDFQFLEKAKELVKKFNLESRTHFTGFLDKEKKLEALVDADIVIYPSFHEAGISIVILEAAAAAKPLIISDNIGFSEEVVEHKAGITVPTKNVDRLKNAIEKMLVNYAESIQMGIRAQQIVKTQFSWDVAVEKHLQVYQEIT